ncbi:MAG: heme o synthase [Anaerolineales bacterium]
MNQPTSSSSQQPGQARPFLWVASLAAVMTFFLIIIGGIVRVTGSGLGCPDWPLCYGRIIPPLEFEAIIEYTHRLVASLTSPLILATAVMAWLRYRGKSWVTGLSAVSIVLLAVQVVLGGITVLTETPPNIVAVHLGTALLILALQIILAVLALRLDRGRPPNLSLRDPLARYGMATTASTFLLLVSGALVTSAGASASCAGWPFCDGLVWPATLLSQVHMLHRIVAGLTGLLIVALAVAAYLRRGDRPIVFIAAAVTLVLLIAQVAVGALNVVRGFPMVLNGLHVATATAVWGGLVLTTALAALDPKADFEAENQSALKRNPSWRDLLSLTKPIVVALLLVTTLAGMIVGAGQWPNWQLIVLTMIGGAFSAGGASALNQYIDRKEDRNMQRTERRPIPQGRVHESVVVAYGLVLCVLGFYVLALFVNLLSAMLALAGMIYYVLLYSLGLKRLTTHNIVIGGGAGAIPPLVGWAAATGQLSVGAFFLFAVVFFWTPPHFWALALVRRQDYARAGVPMLPVIYGERQTRWEILLYTIQVVALTLLLPVANLGGWLFMSAALGLGVALFFHAWRLWRAGGNRNAWKMYRYSSMYLALLFAALVVDTLAFG